MQPQELMGHLQRRSQEYGRLHGIRVRIKTKEAPEFSEVLYLLGQEHDCLIFAKEQPEGHRRNLSFINTSSVAEFEVLLAPPGEDKPRFVQARVAVHATSVSGAKAAIEITGVEPRFGGYFRSPNAALGDALANLHANLVSEGLIAGSLPLHPRYEEVRSVGAHPLLSPDQQRIASLTVLLVDLGPKRLGAVEQVFLDDQVATRGDSTPARVRVWAYEQFCREAIQRKILSPNYRPHIRQGRITQ